MILSSTSSTSRPRRPPWQPAKVASRAGKLAVLEGDWHPERLVLLEFPDLDAAKRFYDSPKYQEAKRLRDGAASLNPERAVTTAPPVGGGAETSG